MTAPEYARFLFPALSRYLFYLFALSRMSRQHRPEQQGTQIFYKCGQQYCKSPLPYEDDWQVKLYIMVFAQSLFEILKCLTLFLSVCIKQRSQPLDSFLNSGLLIGRFRDLRRRNRFCSFIHQLTSHFIGSQAFQPS